MESEKIHNSLDRYLQPNNNTGQVNGEVCDAQTGECYTMVSKDGLVERLNKKFITEDGRQLLKD
jgi:hypothetical protein